MIENISKLVDQKSDHKEIPSILHDHIKEMDNSLNRFREAYIGLKDKRDDLEHLRVDFEDVKREISHVVNDIMRQ